MYAICQHRMTQESSTPTEGPKATLIRYEATGHLPPLVHLDQIRDIDNWLITHQ
jgi:hypothetical protein